MCGNLSIKDFIVKNRSYRRFNQDVKLNEATLKELVDLARLSGSAGNFQPLKYILSCDDGTNATIFSHLAWAGYLKDWPGPEDGEKPTGYIVILGDTELAKSFGCDHGIAAQSILLGAIEKELGGCVIASIKRDDLMVALKIDSRYEILVVLAIGEPKEEVKIETVGEDGDVKYWRDEQSVHHVPKRSLESIVIGSYT
ncbi:MAG: nitroreductase family protein [Candidatus Anammoxibacter sp.]